MRRLFAVLVYLYSTSLLCALEPASLDLKPLLPENVGFLVVEAQTGKEVLAINPDSEYFYASNIKLLTTAAALEYLGGGHRYSTFFFFDPENGTLYIRSGGDPSLVIEKMWVLSRELAFLKIGGIKKVVVDDFLYGDKGIIPMPGAEAGDNAYLTDISPLSLNYNSVEVLVLPTEIGAPAAVHTLTPGPAIIITNNATTAKGEGTSIQVFSKKNGDKTELVVKGSIGVLRKKPQRIWRRIYHPGAHFVKTLLHLMGENSGVPIERGRFNAEVTNKPGVIAFEWKSEPLRDIMAVMNKYSSNFIAESLVLHLGLKFGGNPLSGVTCLKKYASEKLGLVIEPANGSGIGSGINKFTPRFFIKLIKQVYDDRLRSIDLFGTLPVMGEDGTLKKVQHGYSGMVRAKTGTLTGISSLSGIMRGKSGKMYFFTLAFNDWKLPGGFKPMWKWRDALLAKVWEEL